MNKKEILSEANKLVSNGLRKAAIDLLLEHLESDPNSSTVLSALGRVYRLDHQPEKAVPYLKRSLEVKQGVGTLDNNSLEYRLDNFDDDDMNFVESQVEKSSEEDYVLEIDELIQSTTKNDTRRDRIKPTLKDDMPSPEHDDWSETLEEDPGSIFPHGDEETSHVSTIDINDNSNTEKQNRLLGYKSDSSVEIQHPGLTVDEEATAQSVFDAESCSDWVHDENTDLIEDEQLFSDELFENDNDEQDEDSFDELTPTSFLSMEEESDEIIPDDFDDLEEFDEFARSEIEEVQGTGKINQEHRARQIAVKELEKFGWDNHHLFVLERIFIDNGISSCRLAIERCVENGMSADEVSLADEIRQYWKNAEYLWTSFERVFSGSPAQSSASYYRFLSWPMAQKIIKSFYNTPTFDEVLQFIDGLYESWFYDDYLRTFYSSFYRYLVYHLGDIPNSLPAEEHYTFTDYFMDDYASGDVYLLPHIENYLVSAIKKESDCVAECIADRAITYASKWYV